MPNLSFIIGPPESGKTEQLLQRAAGLYQLNPFNEVLILVPTLRHADQIRARLVDLCGVAFQLRVETIIQFSNSIVDPSETINLEIADELLRRVTHEEVKSGPASYFMPIYQTGGFQRSVSNAVNELLHNNVDDQIFLKATRGTGSTQLQGLASLYHAYRRGLAERNWRHPAELPIIAAKAVDKGIVVAPLVLFDGFESIRNGELQLIEKLATKSDVFVTLDLNIGDRATHAYDSLKHRFPSSPVVFTEKQSSTSVSTFAVEAIDKEAELRGIARQIKQLLADDSTLRPSNCVITFRQISPYLELARQIFNEYDLPLDPAPATKLRFRALGIWLRRLIELPRNEWRIRDLSAVLSNGVVNRERWELKREEIALFFGRARRKNLWSGLESIHFNIQGLRNDAQNNHNKDAMLRAADGIEKALVDLQTLLDDSTTTAATHADTIDHILFGPNGLVGLQERIAPGATVDIEALRNHVRLIGQTHEAFGNSVMSREEFLKILETRLESPSIGLREAGGVLLAPMHSLHGLRFKHVFIGGLVEGEFPAPQSSFTLLDRENRTLLSANGLILPPESRSSEDQLWGSVKSRADESLRLWRHRLNDNGRPVASSYYFSSTQAEPVTAERTTPLTSASKRELAIACTQQWVNGSVFRPDFDLSWRTVKLATLVEQRRASFKNAGEFEGNINPEMIPDHLFTNLVWSASRFESYLTCGFQFYGRYVLNLDNVDEEMADVDAATRGVVFHEILQNTLEPFIQSGAPLNSATLENAITHLHTYGPEIWERAPKQYGFGHASLWNLEMKSAFEQLESLLRREAEASNILAVNNVNGAETKLEGLIPLDPPMRVMGIVDRIDQGKDLTVIVDYKSGHPIERRELEAGKRVQLQLYSYLASNQAGSSRMVARYAWVKPPKKEWDLDSAKPEDALLINKVIDTAANVRENVTNGNFHVSPDVPSCPTYCTMIHVCRVNEYTRWKSWS